MRSHRIVTAVVRKFFALTIAAALLAATHVQLMAQTGFDRSTDHEKRQHEDAVSAQFLNVPFLDPELVVAWNRTVNEIAFAEDQFFTFKGVRAHAMMHAAMHDALNAVIPVYRSFAYHGNDFFAHPIAAAAQAAHDVVVSQYPGQQARLDTELATWLSQ